jgi:hypothetical protein
MNSNILTNSNNSYINNFSNKSKYRIKRPYGALQNQYPEFYTTSSKKFKYSSHPIDSNVYIEAFNSDNKKNAAVFSSFSNDVEMSSSNHKFNTGNYIETQHQDPKTYILLILFILIF